MVINLIFICIFALQNFPLQTNTNSNYESKYFSSIIKSSLEQ